MLWFLHVLLRLTLAVSLSGFAIVSAWFPDERVALVSWVESCKVPFEPALLVLLGLGGFVFLIDTLGKVMFEDRSAENASRLSWVRQLLERKTARKRKIVGLIPESQWGAKLEEIRQLTSAAAQPRFEVKQPEDADGDGKIDALTEGVVRITLEDSATYPAYKASTVVSLGNSRLLQARVKEAKARLMHSYIVTKLENATPAEAPPVNTGSAEATPA